MKKPKKLNKDILDNQIKEALKAVRNIQCTTQELIKHLKIVIGAFK